MKALCVKSHSVNFYSLPLSLYSSASCTCAWVTFQFLTLFSSLSPLLRVICDTNLFALALFILFPSLFLFFSTNLLHSNIIYSLSPLSSCAHLSPLSLLDTNVSPSIVIIQLQNNWIKIHKDVHTSEIICNQSSERWREKISKLKKKLQEEEEEEKIFPSVLLNVTVQDKLSIDLTMMLFFFFASSSSYSFLLQIICYLWKWEKREWRKQGRQMIWMSRRKENIYIKGKEK